jgi:hypothetical protein
MLTRGTVPFRDGDGWSWGFDLTFILSNYRCIWGCGCPHNQAAGHHPWMLRGGRRDLPGRRRYARP